VRVKRSLGAGYGDRLAAQTPKGLHCYRRPLGSVEDGKLRSELGSLHDDEVEITIQKRPCQIVNLDDDSVRRVKSALVV
jgi:hypothetical protein